MDTDVQGPCGLSRCLELETSRVQPSSDAPSPPQRLTLSAQTPWHPSRRRTRPALVSTRVCGPAHLSLWAPPSKPALLPAECETPRSAQGEPPHPWASEALPWKCHC